MRLLSWNVNGIRSVLSKNFSDFVDKEKPDVLLVQETKAQQQQVDWKGPYAHHFWSSAEKSGYAGTAIFSKIPPKKVTYGIGHQEHDQEGRVITLEFDNYYVVNVYVPNSGRGLPRLVYRKKWDQDFAAYLRKLDQKKPVVVGGDFNVAHTEIDLANPKSNYNKTAGYTQQEIDGFTHLLQSGFLDSFRLFNSQSGHYTFWSYLFNSRKKNIGWRIDYFLVSNRLQGQIKGAEILPQVMGSDHCPIGVMVK